MKVLGFRGLGLRIEVKEGADNPNCQVSRDGGLGFRML